jgi:hypothetical protein
MEKGLYFKRSVVKRTVAEFLSAKAIETLRYVINDFVVDIHGKCPQRLCL